MIGHVVLLAVVLVLDRRRPCLLGAIGKTRWSPQQAGRLRSQQSEIPTHSNSNRLLDCSGQLFLLLSQQQSSFQLSRDRRPFDEALRFARRALSVSNWTLK
jgi:hypothetical protein